MKPGRPFAKGTRARDALEGAQLELVGMLRDLDEVILRNRQAVRRTAVVMDVLDPGIDRLVEIRVGLLRLHELIKAAWVEGQESNWKE